MKFPSVTQTVKLCTSIAIDLPFIGAVNILQMYAFKNKTFDQLQNIIKYLGTSNTTAHEKTQLKKR